MATRKRPDSDETPAGFHAYVEEQKRNLDPEDMKWYGEKHELVPLAQVIAEVEEYARRSRAKGRKK